MADFDTTHILNLLRQHTALPAVQGWNDASCLRMLTGHMHGMLVPLIKAEWQEHFLSGEANTWTLPLVEAQREYVLPPRAVGAAVRKAVLVGPNGARRPLKLLEVNAQEEWNTARTGTPEGYVVRAGRLYLHPKPTNVTGWYLRAQFLVRPAQLALTSACGEVQTVGGISATTATYTLTTSAVTQGQDGVFIVDAVRCTPPFETLALDATCLFTTSGTTVEIPLASLPAEGLVPGDFVCPRGYAPFAQVPVELLDLLTQHTAAQQLLTIGDQGVAGGKASSLPTQRQDAGKVVTPRTGEPRTAGNGMRKFRGGGGWSTW